MTTFVKFKTTQNCIIRHFNVVEGATAELFDTEIEYLKDNKIKFEIIEAPEKESKNEIIDKQLKERDEQLKLQEQELIALKKELEAKKEQPK